MNRNLISLNATNHLNENLNKFINVFAIYYGEDKRKEIIEKFSKMMFIGYQDIEDIDRIIREEKQRISKELFKIVIEKSNVLSDMEEIVLKAFYTSLDYLKYSSISDCSKFISEYKMGYKNYNEANYNKKFEKIINILRIIFPEITKNNFDEYFSSGKLDFIEKIAIGLNEAKVEYDKYIEVNLEDVIKLNNQLNNKKRTISNENFIDFIEEFKYLLNEEDREKFDSKERNNYFFASSIEGIEIFFGNGLILDSTIHLFNDDSDKVLDDNTTSEYRKDTIKKNRIKYFKYKGIDLGDNYETYINNPAVLKIWPTKELVNELEKRKKYYNNKSNIEFYNSIPFYQEMRKKIDKLGLLDKEDSFNPTAYVSHSTCINPNLVIKNGKYDMYSLVLIYAGLSAFDDQRLIHELNHLYELSLSWVKDNKYQMLTGWDVLSGEIFQSEIAEIDTVDIKSEKREYELFSEIINELIAQEITKLMHSNDIFIFNTKEEAKIKGGTSYESTFALVREFFNEYKKEIIESRRDGNIQIIFDKVGKENFDRLNQLFHRFNQYFAGWNYYNLLNDLNNGKETELVLIYKEILKERDEILINMKSYSSYKSI